jgi:hypothetical protein
MKMIKVINDNDIEREQCHFNEFITQDSKYLYLSYSSLVEDECNIRSYDKYLDELHVNFNIYNLTEKLFLNTDFISELPSNILKFNNLKEIEVQGSRFWDLECLQLPTSVTICRFIDHTNLIPTCIVGMDRLTNLVSLHLDDGPFDFIQLIDANRYLKRHYSDETLEIIPIPNLSTLKSINIYPGDDIKILVPDWKDRVMKHKLFINIKNRIVNVEIKNEYETIIVIDLQ